MSFAMNDKAPLKKYISHKYGMAQTAIMEFNESVSFLLEKGWINPSLISARVFLLTPANQSKIKYRIDHCKVCFTWRSIIMNTALSVTDSCIEDLER